MRASTMASLLVLAAAFPSLALAENTACEGSALDVDARYLMGGSVQLCEAYAGDVVLVVNTASQCGYAGQLAGLQAMQERYREQGLRVIGVPSADFGGQEFAEAEQTAAFCKANFGVDFPLLTRSAVVGDEAHPLFRRLYAQGASEPRWNFHKYLLDRSGRLVDEFRTRVAPDDPRLVAAVEAALQR